MTPPHNASPEEQEETIISKYVWNPTTDQNLKHFSQFASSCEDFMLTPLKATNTTSNK